MNDFDSASMGAVDLRMPGLHLRTFALHRPGGGRPAIEAHPRCWSKAVLFLEEATPMGDASQPGAGTVMMLPPGQARGRAPAEYRMPLCLVFDFRLTDRRPPRATVCALPRAELLTVREQLAYLVRLHATGGPPRPWECAAAILNLLLTLLRTASWPGPAAATTPGSVASAMHRLLLTMPLESPLEQVVERSGYQRDHLNRLVKKETGLTLGQFRAQRRLDRAKVLLARGVKVGAVAGEVGLPDQSYFARWFRRQTGVSPSGWLQADAAGAPLEQAWCG